MKYIINILYHITHHIVIQYIYEISLEHESQGLWTTAWTRASPPRSLVAVPPAPQPSGLDVGAMVQPVSSSPGGARPPWMSLIVTMEVSVWCMLLSFVASTDLP